MFQQGDKISVRAKNSIREGFVQHDGTFLRYRTNHAGEIYAIEYIWCNMGCTDFLDRVTVTARNTEFRLH